MSLRIVFAGLEAVAGSVAREGFHRGYRFTAADVVAAWRIQCLPQHSLRLAFGRHKDAVVAIQALRAAGIWTDDDVTRAGREKVESIAIGALGW